MKPLLFLIALSVALTAHSQLEKGKILAGLQTNIIAGDISGTALAISSDDNSSQYGLNIVPTFGWAIQHNWVIGAQGMVGLLRNNNQRSNPFVVCTDLDLGIAPFTRLYLDLVKDGRFKAFGMASLEFTYFTNRNNSSYGSFVSKSNSDDSQINGSLGGGLGYFGRKIVIDMNASKLGLRVGFYKTFGHSKK